MADIICTLKTKSVTAGLNGKVFTSPCDKVATHAVVVEPDYKSVRVVRRDKKRTNVYCVAHANKAAFIAYEKTVEAGMVTAVAEFGVSRKNPEGTLSTSIKIHTVSGTYHRGVGIRVTKRYDLAAYDALKEKGYRGGSKYEVRIEGDSHSGDLESVKRIAEALQTACQLSEWILDSIGDASLDNLALTVPMINGLNTTWALSQIATGNNY